MGECPVGLIIHHSAGSGKADRPGACTCARGDIADTCSDPCPGTYVGTNPCTRARTNGIPAGGDTANGHQPEYATGSRQRPRARSCIRA